MKPVSDIVGKRFGRLVVLREDWRDDRGRVVWVCRCDCGRETTTTTYQLTHGHKKSCGCRRPGGRGSDALYGLWYHSDGLGHAARWRDGTAGGNIGNTTYSY